jgi:hypothetical protein
MALRPDIARGVEAGLDGVIEYQPSALHQFAPKYKVYIFNVGPLSWTIDPTTKIDNRVARGSAGSYAIEACPGGKAYSKPLILPSIVMSSYIDAATGAMKTDDVEGKYVAQDIVNPNNGGDWSEGVNLSERGVFWTFNETPTEKELSDARAKLEVYLRKMLASATELETKGQLDRITPNMRLAATYFQEDRSWNKIFRKIGECPVCGDPMRENTVKHSCGYVPDPERAYKLGAIDLATRDDLIARRAEPKSKK